MNCSNYCCQFMFVPLSLAYSKTGLTFQGQTCGCRIYGGESLKNCGQSLKKSGESLKKMWRKSKKEGDKV